MRYVLDTDVVRSGLQSASGASRLLLCAIAEGALVPLVTVAILLEYEDVLSRPESLSATGLSIEDVGDFLDGFLDFAKRVVVRQRIRPSVTDPGDEIFVEALLNGGGEAIVSFNRRDYRNPDPDFAGRMAVPVISPGEALGQLTWRPTAITPFAFPHR